MTDPSGILNVGLYSALEAARLTGIPAGKIRRWLRGHTINKRRYDPLWLPQYDVADGPVVLGFRDLTEVRVANAFIQLGLSAQKVRRAIQLAQDLLGQDHPLSTARFRTDGRTVFLQVAKEDSDEQLFDLLKSQYAFKQIVGPSLKDLEFDKRGIPTLWRVQKGIVVDPTRSFGQPIDEKTGVPTQQLAAAAIAEGSIEAAAKAYDVPASSVRRAAAYEGRLAA